MSRDDLDVVILAAGQGKRMRSSRAKVLHEIGGKPMLARVVETARRVEATRVHVVYGHAGEQIREYFSSPSGGAIDGGSINWVLQAERLGTGHAVIQALPSLGQGVTLILYGDVPAVRAETLGRLAGSARRGALALLTVSLADPDGYGRILRSATGAVTGIVEEKDATQSERALREVNTGILAVRSDLLGDWLGRLGNDNAQREYYLTDIVSLAVAQGVEVTTAAPAEREEVLGVNDRVQLAALERYWQRRAAEELMRAGATVMDPARLDIRGDVEVGPDVMIDVNVVLEGRVRLASGVRIGPNSVVRDADIGPDSEVLANCVIDGARVGPRCRIGPYARLRPGTELGAEVHIGNFVEVKKSLIRDGSKANHLSYVGDAEVGRGVNIGAGTITCNYDGASKHRTVIGDGAFIGSGVELVAPVEVGAGATIGAGSTIGHDAPPGELTLERSRQKTVEGWRRPTKRSTD